MNLEYAGQYLYFLCCQNVQLHKRTNVAFFYLSISERWLRINMFFIFLCDLQELSYLLDKDEIKRVWSDATPLAEFNSSGMAHTNINLIINNYFDLLLPSIEKVKKNVIELSSAAKHKLGELTQTIAEYNKSLVIDQSFIRLVIVLLKGIILIVIHCYVACTFKRQENSALEKKSLV